MSAAVAHEAVFVEDVLGERLEAYHGKSLLEVGSPVVMFSVGQAAVAEAVSALAEAHQTQTLQPPLSEELAERLLQASSSLSDPNRLDGPRHNDFTMYSEAFETLEAIGMWANGDEARELDVAEQPICEQDIDVHEDFMAFAEFDSVARRFMQHTSDALQFMTTPALCDNPPGFPSAHDAREAYANTLVQIHVKVAMQLMPEAEIAARGELMHQITRHVEGGLQVGAIFASAQSSDDRRIHYERYPDRTYPWERNRGFHV